MSRCIMCHDFFPPDFLTTLEKNDKMCLWCEGGIKLLSYKDDKGKTLNVTREQVVKEYKEFMKLLLEKKNIRKIVFNL